RRSTLVAVQTCDRRRPPILCPRRDGLPAKSVPAGASSHRRNIRVDDRNKSAQPEKLVESLTKQADARRQSGYEVRLAAFFAKAQWHLPSDKTSNAALPYRK